jgi:hypothetical protein
VCLKLVLFAWLQSPHAISPYAGGEWAYAGITQPVTRQSHKEAISRGKKNVPLSLSHRLKLSKAMKGKGKAVDLSRAAKGECHCPGGALRL